MNEIFVGVKPKDYILSRIDGLGEKYSGRSGDSRALLKSYCHDTIEVLEDCFDTSLLGITRCINKVKLYQGGDNVNTEQAIFYIVDMLIRLKNIAKAMVPIKDLPSCKSLIGLSSEDIVSKAKDLVKNDIVRVGVSALLLGSSINKVVKIEDVKWFYKDSLEELNNEILIKGNSVSPLEQFLLDKFNAEIGYCNLAMTKAGIGAFDAVKDIVEIAMKDIEKYETRYTNGGVRNTENEENAFLK